MFKHLKREQHVLELMLILIAVALATLVYRIDGFKMVIFNLFYLPVVLGGFFLGRYRAGILAVFCVLSTSMITALQLSGFAAFSTPLAVAQRKSTDWGFARLRSLTRLADRLRQSTAEAIG